MDEQQIRLMNQVNRQVNEAIAKQMEPYVIPFLIGGIIWIWVLADIIKSEFENPNNKIMWIMLILFVPPIAMVMYPIIATSQKKTEVYETEEVKNEFKSKNIMRESTDGVTNGTRQTQEKAKKEENWF